MAVYHQSCFIGIIERFWSHNTFISNFFSCINSYKADECCFNKSWSYRHYRISVAIAWMMKNLPELIVFMQKVFFWIFLSLKSVIQIMLFEIHTNSYTVCCRMSLLFCQLSVILVFYSAYSIPIKKIYYLKILRKQSKFFH